MTDISKPTLVIAVSSRALFDSEAEHLTFTAGGVAAFVESEIAHAADPLRPGIGFEMIRRIHAWGLEAGVDVRIAVISRRDPSTGARILRSLAHHGLTRVQGSFTNGAVDLVPYISGFGAHLFLSRDAADVQSAVDAGIPAAQLLGRLVPNEDEQLRIAFDGDAVLFSDESERFFRQHGLDAFLQREHDQVEVPLTLGPMMPFVQALVAIQAGAKRGLFRIAMVTARQGLASERAIRTLASYGVHLDEAHFCGETPKAGILNAFQPHIFFDDSDKHLLPAAEVMAAARVPWRSEPAAETATLTP